MGISNEYNGYAPLAARFRATALTLVCTCVAIAIDCYQLTNIALCTTNMYRCVAQEK